MNSRDALLNKAYVLKCSHKDYISADLSFDISEFWVGAISSDGKKKHIHWAGDFTGRPGLANDLFDAIRGAALYKKPASIRTLITQLRNFWRYLDVFEMSLFNQNKLRINSIVQLEMIHGVKWLRPVSEEYSPADPEVYRVISSIIQVSLNNLGLPPIFWPVAQNRPGFTRKDTPSIEQGIRLVRILTSEAHMIWKRWERADSLADLGRVIDSNVLSCKRSRNVTEADLHATFRYLIRKTGNPLPSLDDFCKFIGLKRSWMPKWWPRHPLGHEREGSPINLENDLFPGLYPTGADLYCLSNLVMARSGWNATTTFALDCSSPERWFRSYGEGLVWLYSYKERGGNWQDTISPENHAGHSYQIIKRLLDRNAKLKSLISIDPSKCELSEVALRSPWVAAHDSKNIGVLGEHSMNQMRAYLKQLIEKYNQNRDADNKLPMFKPSDFRDVFAEAVHRGGNYSILLTQISLGHKSSSTTRRYLRSIAWRKESEEKLNYLVTELFNQIQVHRKIDLTILRARADGVEITQEQLNRLELYRKNITYSGLSCSDPTNPPEWIDPKNPRDGSQICKQGHRCASCPKGRVFEESLPHIARYTAELEWKRKNFGDARWYQSTDCHDFEVYIETLKQWSDIKVEFYLEFWRKKIDSGEHRVLVFSAGVQ